MLKSIITVRMFRDPLKYLWSANSPSISSNPKTIIHRSIFDVTFLHSSKHHQLTFLLYHVHRAVKKYDAGVVEVIVNTFDQTLVDFERSYQNRFGVCQRRGEARAP